MARVKYHVNDLISDDFLNEFGGLDGDVLGLSCNVHHLFGIESLVRDGVALARGIVIQKRSRERERNRAVH